MRILYVEDNRANVLLVERIARADNHSIIHYTDAETALENFVQDDVDMVLTDVQLDGGMSGLEFVRQLRSDGHTLPVICMTNYVMKGMRERCLAAGCDEYIPRPMPARQFLDAVQSIMQRYDRKPVATGGK